MNNTLKALQILMNNEINNTPQVNNTSQVNNIKPSLYEDVRKSQSFINLEKKITNEESFKYAYTLFKYKEMDNNRNRKKTIKEYFEGLNFNSITYPLKQEDYEKIERNNNVCLRVYEPNYNNNKIYAHYQSELGENKRLIVLFLDEGHCSYVKNYKFILKRLVNN